MRIPAMVVLIATPLAVATPSWSGGLSGSLKVGGVALDEVGDLSTVQETYNIYEGFSLSQIYLVGTAPNAFTLDLRDVNLNSRRGDFVYRMPGTFKVTAGYDQNRQVFDPMRGVTSDRRDFHLGALVTPNRWLGISGQFGYLTREGDRLAFPAGSVSALGTRYDNTLMTGQLTAEYHKDRLGGALGYRISDLSDDLNAAADRRGHVISARFYAPSLFYDKWTHFLRGAYGIRELSNREVEHTLVSGQYMALVQPIASLQLKYGFDGSRVDDEATKLKTDRFVNEFDATYYYRQGRVNAGYGFETNDDDRTLTSYHAWHAGTDFRTGQKFHAGIDYAGRVKRDQEELTLLKDIEAQQIRAKLEVRPREGLVVGGGYTRRERDLPDIDVHVDGEVAHGFARWAQEGWAAVSADYSYSTDEFRDLVGGFETSSHIVTARVDLDRIRNLGLAGGVTYLDIGRDLDIEKSILFGEARYRLSPHYFAEVQYHVYNYDDYILIDRYYTANVVRFNLGYDLYP